MVFDLPKPLKSIPKPLDLGEIGHSGEEHQVIAPSPIVPGAIGGDSFCRSQQAGGDACSEPPAKE